MFESLKLANEERNLLKIKVEKLEIESSSKWITAHNNIVCNSQA